MDAEAAEFLSSGYLSPKQHELLRNRVHALRAELRPQAVPLVDAFGIPDFQLNSALGRFDGESLSCGFASRAGHSSWMAAGDVYQNLVRFAQAEPLNAVRFNVDINDPELVVGPEGENRSKL